LDKPTSTGPQQKQEGWSVTGALSAAADSLTSPTGLIATVAGGAVGAAVAAGTAVADYVAGSSKPADAPKLLNATPEQSALQKLFDSAYQGTMQAGKAVADTMTNAGKGESLNRPEQKNQTAAAEQKNQSVQEPRAAAPAHDAKPPAPEKTSPTTPARSEPLPAVGTDSAATGSPPEFDTGLLFSSVFNAPVQDPGVFWQLLNAGDQSPSSTSSDQDSGDQHSTSGSSTGGTGNPDSGVSALDGAGTSGGGTSDSQYIDYRNVPATDSISVSGAAGGSALGTTGATAEIDPAPVTTASPVPTVVPLAAPDGRAAPQESARSEEPSRTGSHGASSVEATPGGALPPPEHRQAPAAGQSGEAASAAAAGGSLQPAAGVPAAVREMASGNAGPAGSPIRTPGGTIGNTGGGAGGEVLPSAVPGSTGSGQPALAAGSVRGFRGAAPTTVARASSDAPRPAGQAVTDSLLRGPTLSTDTSIPVKGSLTGPGSGATGQPAVPGRAGDLPPAAGASGAPAGPTLVPSPGGDLRRTGPTDTISPTTTVGAPGTIAAPGGSVLRRSGAGAGAPGDPLPQGPVVRPADPSAPVSGSPIISPDGTTRVPVSVQPDGTTRGPAIGLPDLTRRAPAVGQPEATGQLPAIRQPDATGRAPTIGQPAGTLDRSGGSVRPGATAVDLKARQPVGGTSRLPGDSTAATGTTAMPDGSRMPVLDRSTAAPAAGTVSAIKAIAGGTRSVAGEPKDGDAARVAPAVNQILERHPDIRLLPKETIIIELIRRLALLGMVGGPNGVSGERAQEVLRFLLTSREQPPSGPASDWQRQGRPGAQPFAADTLVTGARVPGSPASPAGAMVTQGQTIDPAAGSLPASMKQQDQALTPAAARPDAIGPRVDAAGPRTDSPPTGLRQDGTAGDKGQPVRAPADPAHSPPGKPAHGVAGAHRVHGKHEAGGSPSGEEGPHRRHTSRRETAEKIDDGAGKHKHDSDGPDPWIGGGFIGLGGIAKPGSRRGDKKVRILAGKKDNEARSPDRRVRYIVQLGDTLELIAVRRLGDSRFATLILTINRAIIRFKNQGAIRVPDLRPGQVLWLPSLSEQETHRKHFFVASRKPAPARRIFSAPVDPAPPRPPAEDLVFTPPPLVISETPPLSLVLLRIRHSGNRRAVPLDISAPAPAMGRLRRCCRAREGDSLASIAARDALINDAGLWKLIARVNGLAEFVDACGSPLARLIPGQEIMLPSRDEIARHKLMESLALAAGAGDKTTPGTEGAGRAVAVEARMSVSRFSAGCRMVVTEPAPDRDAFMARLQAAVNGQWKTIASYESLDGGSLRKVPAPGGSVEALRMDLPTMVVRMMAFEDFKRNWRDYCRSFQQAAPRPSEPPTGLRQQGQA